ncbi:MAG: hypothetical protein ACRDCE_15725 [Cetobacterium sp.]|uniref:hypothetical protein n=1 Tax=Cetobacterium sp. TaxID=2071632 RepID=UPI003EE5288B
MTKHLNSSIMLDTKAVKEATFGDILIIDFKKEIPYTKISDTSQFKELDVTLEDKIYKKVLDIFSQDNRIDKVSVFGVNLAVAKTAEVKEVQKEVKEVVSSESEKPEEKIIKTTPEQVKLMEKLEEVWSENKGYYFVLTSEFDEELSKTVIQWALSKGLKPAYCTGKETDATKAIEFFMSLNNGTIAFATQKDDDNLDAKMIGLMATDTPGRDKWEWKEPAGAVVSGFSLTDVEKLEDAGINTIQEEREGVLGLFPGKCANGEFIDIEWGRDNMQYDIETAFIRRQKSPFKIYHPGVDPRGVVQIEGVINEVIRDYASDFREFIASDENGKPLATINVKTKYTQQDISARIFEVSWVAIPSGSASYGDIKGLLTFDKTKVGVSE